MAKKSTVYDDPEDQHPEIYAGLQDAVKVFSKAHGPIPVGKPGSLLSSTTLLHQFQELLGRDCTMDMVYKAMTEAGYTYVYTDSGFFWRHAMGA